MTDSTRDLRDCSRQRNLTAKGRREARSIGSALRRLDIPVGEAPASPYCRTRQTARLAFGRLRSGPAPYCRPAARSRARPDRRAPAGPPAATACHAPAAREPTRCSCPMPSRSTTPPARISPKGRPRWSRRPAGHASSRSSPRSRRRRGRGSPPPAVRARHRWSCASTRSSKARGRMTWRRRPTARSGPRARRRRARPARPADRALRGVPLGCGLRPARGHRRAGTGPPGSPMGPNAIVRVDDPSLRVRRFPLPGGRASRQPQHRHLRSQGASLVHRPGRRLWPARPARRGGCACSTRRADLAPTASDDPGGRGLVPLARRQPRGAGRRPSEQRPVVEPPTAGQGARRVWSDSQGRLWISEWNSGQVARYDPPTHRWREWRLPGDDPQPYAVYVDDADLVWLTRFRRQRPGALRSGAASASKTFRLRSAGGERPPAPRS